MSGLIRLLCCGDTENSLLEVQQMTELGYREPREPPTDP